MIQEGRGGSWSMLISRMMFYWLGMTPGSKPFIPVIIFFNFNPTYLM